MTGGAIALRRVLKEPLVHFVLLGVVLFAVSSVVSDADEPAENEIVISAGKINHLAALYERTWQRPPTAEEMDGLVNEFVREEVAYREGLAFGLDRDDTIIRRRIRQKFEFIAEDLSRGDPTDAELGTYLAAHSGDFRVDPRLTFRQVYLNPVQRGDALEADARDLKITLNGDPLIDTSTMGDRILLEHWYRDVSTRDVESLFGGPFAAAIGELEQGTWQGPIESGYGLHLVMVDERSEGRLPQLDEIRDQVQREWDSARRRESIDTLYREMLVQYEIVIEWPEPGEKDGGS